MKFHMQHEQGPKTPRPITGKPVRSGYGVGTKGVWSYGGMGIDIALNQCKIHI